MNEIVKKRWIRVALITVLIGILFFFYSLRSVLWPFVFAFFIAYILNPWVDFLQRRGWSRTFSVFVVFFLIVVLLVSAALLIVPQAYHEISVFAGKIPQYSQVVKTRLAPWLKDLQEKHPAIAAQIEEYWNANAQQKIPQLLAPILGALARTFSGVVDFIVSMLNFLLVPVLAFYLLADFPEFKQRLFELIPPRHTERIRTRLNEVDEALSQFLRGQLSVSLGLAAIYIIGLLSLGVPLAIPIGLFSGLANMVPYLGIVLGIASSMLMSFLDNQDWHRLVWIVALYVFAQLNEGTWMGPLLVGKRTGLHPVIIMLSLVIGGTLFGFMGMLLAVPFMAVASVFIKTAYEEYVSSDWYKEHVKAIAVKDQTNEGI